VGTPEGERVSIFSHLKTDYAQFHNEKYYKKYTNSSYWVLGISAIFLYGLLFLLWLFGIVTAAGMKKIGDNQNLTLAILAANAILIVLTSSIAYFYKDSKIPFEKRDEILEKVKVLLVENHGKEQEMFVSDFNAINKLDWAFLRKSSDATKDLSINTHISTLILIFLTTGLAIVSIPLCPLCSDRVVAVVNAQLVNLELLAFILLAFFGIKYISGAMKFRNDVNNCIDYKKINTAYTAHRDSVKGFNPSMVTAKINEIKDLMEPK
jgi:hypothetical protein